MSILLFFIVLFVLILVHELGHFLAAKRFGIRVDEFGIGFPPKVFGIRPRGSETEYTFNWLPIGGFVRIFGEDPNDENTNGPDRERSFVWKPKWQQAIVLGAGVTFNVVFAWMLLVGSFIVGIPTSVATDEAHTVQNPKLLVVATLPDSPAARAGITPGNEVLDVFDESGMRVDALTPEAVITFITSRPNQIITMRVRADGAEKDVTVAPMRGIIESEPDRVAIGTNLSIAGIKALPPHKALWEGTIMTASLLKAVTVGLGMFLYDTLRFQPDFSQVAGPVGIVGMVGDASSLGFAYLVTFTALISLNLAVINLLPFPALDGGRLLFVVIEKIRGARIPPAVTNTLNRVGFALLIILMIAITYKDVMKLIQ